jgi:hypothetical protein
VQDVVNISILDSLPWDVLSDHRPPVVDFVAHAV